MIQIDKEFQGIIPPLSPEEYAGLEKNLLAHGCLDTLKVWGDVLVDGHNRHAICTKHSLPYKTQALTFPDRSAALEWIIRNQFDRRNITDFVRFELTDKLAEILKEQGREKQSSAGGDKKSESAKPLLPIIGKSGFQEGKAVKPNPRHNTQAKIAKSLGWSKGKVAQAKIVKEKAPEPVKEKLRNGEVSLNQAYTQIKKEINEEKKQQERAKKIESVEAIRETLPVEKQPLPSLVLADPPWQYRHCATSNRKIENHYETATHEDIVSHKPQTQKDCLLLMWATAPKLAEAIDLLHQWGFDYRTCAVWDKEMIGMGYWFRSEHELLLVGVKGNISPPQPEDRRSSMFREKRTKHSKKPENVYEWIESAFPGHVKLEMYCREPREGWQVWGNEV